MLFAVSFQVQITSNTKLARLHYYDPNITVSNNMSDIIPVWTFGILMCLGLCPSHLQDKHQRAAVAIAGPAGTLMSMLMLDT